MVATVRAMAAHLAGRADFDIDTIADLRLAVDEACDSLIEIAAPGATLRCVFTIATSPDHPDTMHAEVVTMTEPQTTVDTSGFGWQLLRTLTDQIQLETNAGGRSGHLAIRFTTHSDQVLS
ncbi:MAG: ATP-binding protein [Pseudonocardia sp.]|nr:ATP-binding protein [Pseudonocardia sp.]